MALKTIAANGEIFIVEDATQCEKEVLRLMDALPPARQVGVLRIGAALQIGMLSVRELASMTHSAAPWAAWCTWWRGISASERARVTWAIRSPRARSA